MYTLVVLLVLAAGGFARNLETYNVDPTKISVSGLSSGGAMAMQLHVAFSSTFMGVGIFAGIPYYCAENRIMNIDRCTDFPEQIPTESLIGQTVTYQSSGRVDPTSNMLTDKVYVFQGTLDTTIYPGVAVKVVDYYRHYVHDFNIHTEFDHAAVHGFPTFSEGSACDVIDPEYINRCLYDGAFHALDHIYGGLIQPVGPVTLAGEFYEFDQAEFFYISFPSQSDMDTIGYAYIPSGCIDRQKACKLHMVFHGCLQGRVFIGDSYATKTGYNEVGELNDIIMIYPQAVDSAIKNVYGCWDWWGYTGNFYATKDGNQMLPLSRMINKAAGI